ncbi:MAG: cytochrome ubiquinol oxidase subunit I [Bacteroidetes bacterium CG18_big_fil_WC_8_21_14_2_50_41_14]|nr:MAG: cytochrome ubiquinol oxidase subunit I [Bacteroidetes bacterium CG18_big_fil_WC_8_21_14_2_50_41_14]PJB56658.1 MAG: cytochrome ubiquinol oxidase subunit I [Bacteroidetes bacterium CG_4_9_14_3_um_filter_41_19]
MEHFDMALVDWSRAQFALTAMYHWIFVPLTLGLSFIVAIMMTIYVRTGNELWKKITKFWMTLFGVNFAIGVATGIILEFEFGTNWSNYSWFVGDIFGAPLAIEGIMAFFLESTFIAILFFGWGRVSKKFHLISAWLVAIGSNLSALWILVANAWMQNPVGMRFNPDTARNEMVNFWEVLFSPTAINKFLHTISSGYVLSAIFVVGVSAWFLLKHRNVDFAKKSMIVAAVFGLLSSFYLVLTGDESARDIYHTQPMKFAAFEGLDDGNVSAPLVVIGFLKEVPDPRQPDVDRFAFKIEIPNLLSYMVALNSNVFVPGINDLINGNEKHGIMSYYEKIDKGKLAIKALGDYKDALERKDQVAAAENLKVFEANYAYFGYGYYDDPNDLVPSVPMAFYSFHIMVILGVHFMILFIVLLVLLYKKKIEEIRWVLYIALWTIPLAYIASQAGWVLAEMGRQPWVVQDLMPTLSAVSNIDKSSVVVTFWIFAVTFTVLLIAEIKIMVSQIVSGSKNEGGH